MESVIEQICALRAQLTAERVARLGKRLKLAPRCLALAAIANAAGQLLVDPGHDAARGLHYYRLLGGGVEFGERSAVAVVRELQEELGLAAVVQAHLGVLENLFTFAGEPGHEVIFVYRAAFADPSAYQRHSFAVHDVGRAPSVAVWRSLAQMEAEGRPLFPDGVAALLA